MIGIYCLVLPTMPAVLDRLKERVFSLRSGQKSFTGFFFLTLSCVFFVGGGFMLNTVYQWGVVCYQLIKIVRGNTSDSIVAYKAFLLFSLLDPSGYLAMYEFFELYRVWFYVSRLTFYTITAVLMISAGVLAITNHNLPHFEAVLLGSMALLPEIFLRYLSYSSVTYFGGHLSHLVTGAQILVNFLTAAVLSEDVQTV